MTIHLRIWRQAGPDKPGRLVPYTVEGIIPDMSFLEMLDVLNENLIAKGEDPVAFDSDCREGICGTCGFVVSGLPGAGKPPTRMSSVTVSPGYWSVKCAKSWSDTPTTRIGSW